MDVTWLLGFDASTPRSVAALGRIDDRGEAQLVAHDDDHDGANQASSRLVGRLGALMAQAGIAATDIGFVGCGRGPGTFTGTRVAVATAKGLAVGLGRPILPVSTLAAVALSHDDPGLILAILDARRGEVYASLLECEHQPPRVTARGDERVAPLADVVATLELGDPPTPVGPGVGPYRDALPHAWQARAQPMLGPSPMGLWRALVAAHRAAQTVSPEALEAVYLRRSYAELGINKPKRPVTKSPFI